ncbi:MAG: PIN domain-containing protein [Planctomycetota bacterium]
MGSPAIFLDTVALLALINRHDVLHERARAVHAEPTAARRQLVTTDWVLAEFLGGAARRPLRAAAVRTITRLQTSPRVPVFPATYEAWLRAFLFASRSDKDWSLVDCASMLLCRNLNIAEVFSADRHFVQAGSTTLLRTLCPDADGTQAIC